MMYLQLFWEFFKTGLFAVGGGLATLPFLQDMADRTGWFTHAQLADMLAVAQSVPAAMGVNLATYVGYTVGGVPGTIAAVLGLGLPAVLLIALIARVLQQFRHNRYVEAAFRGLRPASTGLIGAAGITVVMIALMDKELFQTTGNLADLFRWKAWILAAVVLVLTNWVKPTKKWHPAVFIAISAVAGVVFHFAGV